MRTPGGIHQPSWDGINSAVDKHGWTRTAKRDTKYGEIVVCEKFEPNEEKSLVWKVWWIARDMACELECNIQSSRSARVKAAFDNALENLVRRETVHKEF